MKNFFPAFNLKYGKQVVRCGKKGDYILGFKLPEEFKKQYSFSKKDVNVIVNNS